MHPGLSPGPTGSSLGQSPPPAGRAFEGARCPGQAGAGLAGTPPHCWRDRRGFAPGCSCCEPRGSGSCQGWSRGHVEPGEDEDGRARAAQQSSSPCCEIPAQGVAGTGTDGGSDLQARRLGWELEASPGGRGGSSAASQQGHNSLRAGNRTCRNLLHLFPLFPSPCPDTDGNYPLDLLTGDTAPSTPSSEEELALKTPWSESCRKSN